MTTNAVLLILATMIGAIALIILYVYSNLQSDVPTDDRQYMDELPVALRLVWPLVRLLDYHLTSRINSDKLESTSSQLNTSGVSHLMTAEQFYAVRIMSMFVVTGFWFLIASLLKMSSLTMVFVCVVGGYFYPILWLRDRRLKRHKQVQRSLPMFLDFITMAVEAGLNLTGALNQVVQKGPAGPLRQEFFMVVRDLRSGLPRADALYRMHMRLQMPEVTSFVGTVVQAEKMGASLGKALRSQAEQRRNERFMRAEKLAMEAPVKLIGPLMMFIFPCTFIVIGFPIVMKFLKSGMV
jgi:tight adherence protein C